VSRSLVVALLIAAMPSAGWTACTLSASAVAFGVYVPSATATDDSTGAITVTCAANSGLAGYTIALSIGGGASYAARRMTSGSFTLPYQLFTDATRVLTWGDGTGGSIISPSIDLIPLVGGVSTYSIYGRIAAGLVVNPGVYSDTITATITY
jgi:spore coat protein U-like protein